MLFFQKQIVNKNKGFTLIEVLVSMSIFTIVVTMAVGTLLVLVDANSKTQSTQSVITNLSFALDSMTREIRTGINYYCTNASNPPTTEDLVQDCAGGGTALVVTEGGDSLTSSVIGSRIAYRYDAATQSIQRRLGQNGLWQRVTAPEVIVSQLSFIVADALPESLGNLKSPTVTLYVTGTAGVIAGLDTSFNMQTTITQQILDI